MILRENRSGFTMIELIMVIVIVGILAAVAIPKFAMNRDDAIVANAKTTISSIRSALATEKQRRVLSGNFQSIYSLSKVIGYNKDIFDGFDKDPNTNTYRSVLEYPLISCKDGNAVGCWRQTSMGSLKNAISQYEYVMPESKSHKARFELKNNKFNCKSSTDKYCQKLTNRIK